MRKVIIFVLLCSTLLIADKVYLNNGDIVSGKIMTMTEGKLSVETEMFGTVSIDIANVKTFETGEPLAIHLSDGSVLNHKAVAAQKQGVIDTEGDIAASDGVSLDKVTSINPPAKEESKWGGNIRGGAFYSSGNTSKDSYNLGLSLRKETENDRINLGADTIRSREENAAGDKEVSEDWWKIAGKYDYFVSKKDYIYGNAEYKKDVIAELDRRVILGGGYGRKIFDTSDMKLDTELGIASIYESYENEPSESDMTMRAAYKFFKRISETLVFNHGLEYYPKFESFSDYYLSTFGELRLDVTSAIFTNYRVIFDYDPTPGSNSGSTDVKHILGVGVDF